MVIGDGVEVMVNGEVTVKSEGGDDDQWQKLS